MRAETVSRPVAGEPSEPSPQTVSIREADQRAEEIYRQVEATGVPVTVTDQGHPIAQIIPIRTSETPYERLLREGEVRPARRSGHVRWRAWDLPEGVTLQQLLDEDREEIDLSVLS